MFISILKEDLKRVFYKKSARLGLCFYVIAGILNFIFITSEWGLISRISAWEIFVNSQGGGSGFLMLLLPILVTISSGDFLIKEKNSSVMSYMLIKTKPRLYIKNRILSQACVSSIFILVCQLLLLIVALIVFPVNYLENTPGMIFYAVEILMSNPLIYVLIIIGNSLLMSIFFSIFSSLISILFKNLYIVLMLPYLSLVMISMLMMIPRSFVGSDHLLWHLNNYAPLLMVGEYVSIIDNVLHIPIYWTVLVIVTYLITVQIFKRLLKKEKLLA